MNSESKTTELSQTPSNSAVTEIEEKKIWKPLHLKVLDVPSETRTGVNRLDPPTEDFFAYRVS